MNLLRATAPNSVMRCYELRVDRELIAFLSTEVRFDRLGQPLLTCYTGDATHRVHIDNPHDGDEGSPPDNGMRDLDILSVGQSFAAFDDFSLQHSSDVKRGR